MLQQPRALWTLSYGKLWDTFSYFGTQTILVLYFIKVFHLDTDDSYLLYGAYAAFIYATPFLGGVIADRWLGSKQTLLIGCILSIGGNLMLISQNRYLFSLGLATSVVGSGLYKSNATQLVGALYKNNELNKESGFTGFYLAMNIGGSIAPLVYGFVSYLLGWNYGFLCSAFGILTGTLLILKHWSLLENKTHDITIFNQSLLYLGIVFLCLTISLPFYFPALINPIICTLFLINISYLLYTSYKHQGTERSRLLGLLMLSFFGMFYYAAGLQTGSTITLFIQNKIDHGVINTSLPASSFSMLYSLFVLFLAPVFTIIWRYYRRRGIEVSTPKKLSIGIILATAGMGTFAITAYTNIIFLGLIIGFLFLSAGELALTPAVYTAISNLSPPRMKSTMMGCWLLFVGLGGYISALLASVSHQVSQVFSFQQPFLGEFAFIAAFTCIIALFAVLLASKLSTLLK